MSVRAHLRHLRSLLVAPALALAVGLGLVAFGPAPQASAASGERVAHAAGAALRQVGDPYRWGGSGPGSFDCSGLIKFAYRKAGITMPRTSRAQAGHARKIKKSNLRRGDLMFFHSGGRVYHAAIFLRWTKRGALMVHAPGSGERVKRATPWTRSWYAATLRRR